MPGSSLHTVTRAIYTRYASVQFDGLKVSDGRQRSARSKVLCEVGWMPAGGEAITTERQLANAGGVGCREVVTIWSLLSAKGPTTAEARALLDQAFTALVGAVEQDALLDGAVGSPAFVSQIRYYPDDPDVDGSVHIAFATTCTALYV